MLFRISTGSLTATGAVQGATVTGTTSVASPLVTNAGALAITTTASNGDITITPNGTGKLLYGATEVATVNATPTFTSVATGSLTATGAVQGATVTGTTSVASPLVTNAGALAITTTASNGDITITPNGTGKLFYGATEVAVVNATPTFTSVTTGTLTATSSVVSPLYTAAPGADTVIRPPSTRDIVLQDASSVARFKILSTGPVAFATNFGADTSWTNTTNFQGSSTAGTNIAFRPGNTTGAFVVQNSATTTQMSVASSAVVINPSAGNVVVGAGSVTALTTGQGVITPKLDIEGNVVVRSGSAIHFNNAVASYVPYPLNYYEETTFTSNVTGSVVATNLVFYIIRVGQLVNFFIPNFNNAGGATGTATVTNAIPTRFCPSEWTTSGTLGATVNQNVFISDVMVVSNGARVAGEIRVTTAGAITFTRQINSPYAAGVNGFSYNSVQWYRAYNT